jgi:coenzyme F420-0:L-glutamate ligase
VLRPPQDDLYAVLEESVPVLRNGDVLFVTSKVAAIHQGRCLRVSDVASKDELIAREADRHLPRSLTPGEYAVLTVKGGTLLPSAGVDESNADGYYVLWPTQPHAFAADVRRYLMRRFSLHELGVVLTDSHCVPLRRGVVGVAIGVAGFRPVRSRIDELDLFGRRLKVTAVNVADGLAAAAVLLMGEGAEQTPLALARHVAALEFTDEDCSRDLFIPPDQDIFAPLLKAFNDDATGNSVPP